MVIAIPTRKMLWARSHNRCALCRRVLTVDADSPALTGLVFGAEAHIVARSPDGPRGRAVDRDTIDIDGLDNLMLLCHDDHKRIDDQPDVFTRELLLEKKKLHEAWADAKFTEQPEIKPIRVIKGPDEEGVPFDVLTSGAEVWTLIKNAGTFVPYEFDDDDEDRNDAADSFIEAVTDWGMIQDAYSDSQSQLRNTKRNLNELLENLWAHQLFAYGRRLERTITGGYSPPVKIIYAEILVLTAERVKELQNPAGLAADST